jgi:hypothetical protein
MNETTRSAAPSFTGRAAASARATSSDASAARAASTSAGEAVERSHVVAALPKVAGEAPLAATDVECQTTRRRQQLEEALRWKRQ